MTTEKRRSTPVPFQRSIQATFTALFLILWGWLIVEVYHCRTFRVAGGRWTLDDQTIFASEVIRQREELVGEVEKRLDALETEVAKLPPDAWEKKIDDGLVLLWRVVGWLEAMGIPRAELEALEAPSSFRGEGGE